MIINIASIENEDVILTSLKRNKDGSISATAEVHLYINGKTYTGFSDLILRKERG
jgi:hypothetical protein